MISTLLATADDSQGGSALPTLILFLLIPVAMYFLLIRPQQKRAKEHQAMLSKLASGDEVVTAGGIVGKIREINDNFVSLEVADGVCITVQRSQVTSLVPKGTYKSA